MKVKELKDKQLDAFVAKADGWKVYKEKRGEYELCVLQKPGEREPWQGRRDSEQARERHAEVALIEAQNIGFFGISIPSFSTDWSQGGPIFHRELESCEMEGAGGLWKHEDVYKCQLKSNGWVMEGETPLIAICRCFVAEHFGEEVDDR